MSDDKKALITQRGFEESDLPFVYATWMRSFYYGNNFSDLGTKEDFFDEHRKVIERILDDPKTVVRMACLIDDPDIILGYSVIQDGHILHFVFVKEIWRNQGIAKELVPDSIDTITHLTRIGKSIRHKKYSYKPELLLEAAKNE